MAIFKKRGYSFTKYFIIPNKKGNKVLFGFIFSIGINAQEVHFFNQTACWFDIGIGFNAKEGDKAKGLFLTWNVKRYDHKGRLIK